jgi:hypothetical protein
MNSRAILLILYMVCKIKHMYVHFVSRSKNQLSIYSSNVYLPGKFGTGVWLLLRCRL